MSNFHRYGPSSDKKDDETGQTGGKIPPTANQKLTDFQRIYHWANLISIPIIVAAVLAGISTRYGASTISIGIAYVIISSLMNETTRNRLLGFVRSTRHLDDSFRLANVISDVPGCSSSWIGQIFIIFMMFVAISLITLAFTIAAAGVAILIPVLWISSLKAILQDNANQKGNS